MMEPSGSRAVASKVSISSQAQTVPFVPGAYTNRLQSGDQEAETPLLTMMC